MPLEQIRPGQRCAYCGTYCWIVTPEPRFDGATLIATCPEGKAMDRCCEAIAEAHAKVNSRRGDK